MYQVPSLISTNNYGIITLYTIWKKFTNIFTTLITAANIIQSTKILVLFSHIFLIIGYYYNNEDHAATVDYLNCSYYLDQKNLILSQLQSSVSTVPKYLMSMNWVMMGHYLRQKKVDHSKVYLKRKK